MSSSVYEQGGLQRVSVTQMFVWQAKVTKRHIIRARGFAAPPCAQGWSWSQANGIRDSWIYAKKAIRKTDYVWVVRKFCWDGITTPCPHSSTLYCPQWVSHWSNCSLVSLNNAWFSLFTVHWRLTSKTRYIQERTVHDLWYTRKNHSSFILIHDDSSIHES